MRCSLHRGRLQKRHPQPFGVVGPPVRLADGATLPFAEGEARFCFLGGAEEAQGEVRVGGWEEAGDAGGVVEAVCLGGGGEDCAVGAGDGEEGGGDEGVRVEVAGCEVVGAEGRGAEEGLEGGELGVEGWGVGDQGVEGCVCFWTWGVGGGCGEGLEEGGGGLCVGFWRGEGRGSWVGGRPGEGVFG